MKKKFVLQKLIMILIVFVLMLSGTGICYAEEPVSIYVSINGSDDAAGSFEAPLKTLTAARNMVRNIRAAGGGTAGITVYVRGGVYNLTEQLQLTEEDSGTAEAPVIWRNYSDESVTLTGGVSVTGHDFTKVTNATVLNKIVDTTARQSVYYLDLKDFGIEDPGAPYYQGAYSYSSSLTGLGILEEPKAPGMEVFYNGTAMTLARYPNEGNLTVKSVVAPGWNYDDKEAYPAGTPFTITVEEDRMKYWTAAPADSVLMYGFWKFMWADQTIPIGSINTKNKEITSKWHSVFSVKSGAPFYVFNLLEEMDTAGEYYIDRENSYLYIQAPEGIENANITISVLEDELIYINGADYVSFQGFSINSARKAPFRIENSSGCSIKHCEFFNIADYAVKMAGSDNTVSDCYIYDTNGGVRVWGGDAKTLTPANNRVLNCHIERFSRLDKTYKPAVSLDGVGNLVAFNKIHDGPHQAISYGGNNNKIYYNEIYDVVQSTDDAGAIYGGLSWVSRGHEIKYNYIHDLASDQPGVGIWAVFLDGGQCDMTVEGNIFENIDGEAVFVSGGCDNTVHNNYMINCEAAVQIIQSIGVENLKKHHYPGLPSYIWKDGEWQSDIWKEAYPEFYEMMQLPDEEKVIPKNNIFTNNICYETADFVVRNPIWLQEGYEKVNYVATEDPGFVSLGENRDYSLKKDAPVLSVLPNLERLPFNCMGLKGSVACLQSEGFYSELVLDEDTCNLCYQAEQDEEAMLYCATYEKVGNGLKMVSLEKEPVTLVEGERLHYKKTTPITKNTVIKNFLWTKNNLQPLCAGSESE